jgi:septum formation protein
MIQVSHNLVLGSKSPRRQELLKGMGVDFIVRTQDSDESFSDQLPLDEVAEFLAIQKANVLISTLTSDELLICSDTAVIVDNQFLAKPSTKKEAIKMITSLSGRTHKVITGVSLSTHNNQWSFSDTTLVTFSTLSASEIEYYVEHYKPYDKAGSYGIQEWIGYIGIEKMDGSYFNVMGLPTAKLWQELKRIGIIQMS